MSILLQLKSVAEENRSFGSEVNDAAVCGLFP